MARRKKLYRSRDNKVLTGLAGGIGEYFDIDPTVVRVIMVVLEFASAGLLIIGYLIVSLIVPEEPEASANERQAQTTQD